MAARSELDVTFNMHSSSDATPNSVRSTERRLQDGVRAHEGHDVSRTHSSGTEDDQTEMRRFGEGSVHARAPALMTSVGSSGPSHRSTKARLASAATSTISVTDAGVVAESQNSDERSDPRSHTVSRRPSFGSSQHTGHTTEQLDDTLSIRSRAVTSINPSVFGEVGSLFEDVSREGDDAALDAFEAEEEISGYAQQQDQSFEARFRSEFIELEDLKNNGSDEDALMLAWSLKLKHFLILTSAGKPIWSRHGDDQLISNMVGVIQTIISSYQEDHDVLKAFTAGQARFTILSKGHLHLVAMSRMGESDGHLRSQLEALYMQILSTLTLPALEKHFQNRPSTDLRRPLQGTEKLLNALADGFTRGSPSTLLASLESLHLRRAHRAAINNAFLKSRCAELLYGLLVTSNGQLVSVLRPKKHSLHPGDLQLIFNMLFEAKSVRAGGGESWVPLCLPGFNSNGYVYMYVSFLEQEPVDNEVSDLAQPFTSSNSSANPTSSSNASSTTTPPALAIVLISAQRDAFDALRRTRDALLTHVKREPIKTPLTKAMYSKRLSIASLVPGTSSPSVLQHFLFKSRTHVQYTLPCPSEDLANALSWRRLMNRYDSLYAIAHGQGHGHGRGERWHWTAERDGMGVAWITAEFEAYGLASPRHSRASMTVALVNVVKWAKKEEERIFVVGGAVF